MKKLIIFFLFVCISFANELEIKKAEVTLSINAEEYTFKKGHKLKLEVASNICYINGKGRILINKKVQLFSKTKKCHQLEIPKGFDIGKYLKKNKERFVLAFIESKEKVRNGVATKGSKGFDDKEDILIRKDQKELLLYSKEFGPHPIVVNIKNTQNKIIASFVNEENDITFFKVNASLLKTDYKLEILNGFDEIIVEKKIVKE